MPSKVASKSRVNNKSHARRQSQSHRKAAGAARTSVAVKKGPPPASASIRPLQMFKRVASEVSQSLNDLAAGRVPPSSDLAPSTPHVDVTQHNDELVIRVDLPGTEKSQIKISVGDSEITVYGERRRPAGEERDGVYASERGYGPFYRTIPLPAGAVTAQAKASVRNGVLEIRGIRLPAANQAEGRPVDITE
jgi:HSP20 family molecular chaperone IbpA